MSHPRFRRALALAIAFVAAAATAGVAFGQAAAPSGDYGGGAIAVPVKETTVAKDMVLSIRAGSDGRIGVDGQIYARCGLGTISGDGRIGSEGRFTLRGDITRRPLVGTRNTSTFVVSGTLTAAGGEGTANVRLRVRTKGRATRSCTSRTVSWKVRQLASAAAPSAGPAQATLYGTTSQNAARAKQAIVLHAASGGRRIERAIFGYRANCDRGRIVESDDVNITAEFDVAADGSFRHVERFTTNFKDVKVATTAVLRGQFDAAGNAAGKVSVTERYASRRSGKRVDVCATGTRSWSARQ
ncbi:MAG TPA: hypothetical protein VGV90_08480 [Solirubrobacteraceae bacterium]|nr:hypothetical protein [Solirubrobacteraceae bacterium]